MQDHKVLEEHRLDEEEETGEDQGLSLDESS